MTQRTVRGSEKEHTYSGHRSGPELVIKGQNDVPLTLHISTHLQTAHKSPDTGRDGFSWLRTGRKCTGSGHRFLSGLQPTEYRLSLN